MSQDEGGGAVVADGARAQAVLAFIRVFGDDTPRMTAVIAPAFAEFASLKVFDDEAYLGDIVCFGMV